LHKFRKETPLQAHQNTQLKQGWEFNMDISFETPDFTNIFESVSKKLESGKKEPHEKKLENELKITEDYFEKLRICNLILDINQDSIIARLGQIRSYLELNHPEKAFEIASDILLKLKKFPGTKNNSELLIAFILMCAKIKSIEKKYQESLIFLDEGLLLDENYLTLLIAKGNNFFDLEKFPEAIEYYKKALDVDPDNAQSNFKVGEILRLLEKFPEAIEYYKKALDVDPDNLEIMAGTAHAYGCTDEKQIAIDYYDKILKIEPNNMEIQTYRIVCLDKGNSELISIINEKLKDDENNQDLLINKAIILSNMKKFKEAEECFDKILTNNDLGILVDIRKHFKKTTAIDENNKLAKNNLVK
jgi:tetratricopeptide (TPR) repeat protein